MKIKITAVTLFYTCPDCGEKSTQPLTAIVQNGTHTCGDCGVDMLLDDQVRIPANWPERMWINQPSTLQPQHKLNGTNVLAVHEYDNTFRIYFLNGKVESQQIDGLALSKGWI